MENLILALLPTRRFSVLLRYTATLAIIGITYAVRVGFENALHGYPLLLFIPAIFLCALLFDRGSGIVATAAAALLAAYGLIEPRNSLAIGWGATVPLAVFVLIGLMISAVTETLRRTIEKLSAAEAGKELLLHEMAHRMKNDLAMVSSILTLQARSSPEMAVRQALDDAVARIGVLAKAQDRLHVAGAAGRVNLHDYIKALCQDLGDLLRGVRPIAVRVEADAGEADINVAVSIGLMINELVTNAFKYAFPERGGTITVTFRCDAEGGAVIIVEDDGIGCPAMPPAGLGTRLVSLLAKQLKGTVEREDMRPGCRTSVSVRLR